MDRNTQDTSGDLNTSRAASPASADSGSTGSTGFGAATGSTQVDDAGTRAGSYDRKFTNEEPGGLRESVDEGREGVAGKLDDGRARLSGAVETGKNRVAEQIERLGDRLEERARGMEEAGGVQRRAGHVALRASGALDTGAEYIRSHDPNEMRADLERAIRERPLMSVGMAVGAGFLLARLLRD